MKTLVNSQLENAVGGILINPVTVMIAVQLVRVATPYVTGAAIITATAAGTAVGASLAEEGGE